MGKGKLSEEKLNQLLATLKDRFDNNRIRHEEYQWEAVHERLQNNQAKLRSLYEMEASGGEPDVVTCDEGAGEYLFFDCSAESPVGRRSVCYDRAGQESRKKFAPEHNAIDLASEMGIDILTEAQYRSLQKFGPFDTKTSSWLKTPEPIRALGGALFGDYRYGQVFIYHNGAQSYYAARGFRGVLKV